MTWKIANGEAWVGWDGEALHADPVTLPWAQDLAAGPVPITPQGPDYAGPDRELAAYLAARVLIDDPKTVTGDVPAMPDFPSIPGVIY